MRVEGRERGGWRSNRGPPGARASKHTSVPRRRPVLSSPLCDRRTSGWVSQFGLSMRCGGCLRGLLRSRPGRNNAIPKPTITRTAANGTRGDRATTPSSALAWADKKGARSHLQGLRLGTSPWAPPSMSSTRAEGGSRASVVAIGRPSNARTAEITRVARKMNYWRTLSDTHRSWTLLSVDASPWLATHRKGARPPAPGDLLGPVLPAGNERPGAPAQVRRHPRSVGGRGPPTLSRSARPP